MHIRCGQSDIAQRGSLEFPHIFLLLRESVEPQVRLRIRELALYVVEPRIVELNFGESLAVVVHATREVEAAVAVEAFQTLAEEECFAAFGGVGDGIRIVTPAIPVVG